MPPRTDDRACPLCGGEQTRPVLGHSDFPGSQVLRCDPCRHWFCTPEPDDAWLAAYYRSVYGLRRRAWLGEPYCVLMERRADAQLQFIHRAVRRRGLAWNPAGSTALDWGCGVGALVARLQQERMNARGVDTDEDVLALGRSRYPGARLENASAPAAGSQYDLLTLSHLVEHLTDLQRSLAGMLAVVRKGGYVFIEVPHCAPEMFQDAELDCESHIHFFSKRSLLHVLEQVGLETLACEDCGPPVYPGVGSAAVAARARLSSRALMTSLRRILRLGPRSARPVTQYDGYYDFYPKNESGLWLRYVGRVRDSHNQ